MNSDELELFPFVITSGRNSDNCDIILIEIYTEGRKMLLHEKGKVVLVLCKKNVQASQCGCSMCLVHNQCQPKVMYGTCYKQRCLIC